MIPDQRGAQQAAGLPTTSFAERLAAVGPDKQALYRVLLRVLAAADGHPHRSTPPP